MSQDIVVKLKARRDLALNGSPGPQRPQLPGALPARVKELIAAAGGPQVPTYPVEPPRIAPAPGPAKIDVAMTCSSTGAGYIGVVEIAGNTARLVGSRLVQPGRGGAAGGRVTLPGTYSFEAVPGWACPICKTRDNHALNATLVWKCGCELGAFHCVGSVERACYCACGRFEQREFTRRNSFEVYREQAPPAQVNPRSTPRGTTPAMPPRVAGSLSLPRLTERR